MQGHHMDETAVDIELADGVTVRGKGRGFSSFTSITDYNSMLIATWCNETKEIINEKLVEFGKGDCLILPFGTLHAGDRNRTRSPTYKVFSEVYTTAKTDNTSQLWAIQGKGFTKTKQPYQLHETHCPISSCNNRKRKDNSNAITIKKRFNTVNS